MRELNLWNGVQVGKENEKFTVMYTPSPKNIEFGHFTLLFCWLRQGNVQKHKTHVQSNCFCSLNLLLCGVLVAVAVVVAKASECLNYQGFPLSGHIVWGRWAPLSPPLSPPR